MPYDYRQITPEQRAELVRQRKERGYPLHAPPHPFRFPGYYLITAVNYEHAHIMADPARRTTFEARLLEEMNAVGAESAGWVVLPNHYHILLGVQTFDIIPKVIKRLHNGSSYEWNRTDGLAGQRRVWYKYYDRMIRNQEHYFQTLNYIHLNPHKHGYVQDPNEWPWSSLSMYYEERGRQWLREKWTEYTPPRGFGDGWDDDSPP